MGLKIIQFKKNGGVFVDAYAKVSSINYNNDTKIASFGISIYPSKVDRNMIYESPRLWVKVDPGFDIVEQCYNRIGSIISQTLSQIELMQSEIDSIVGNDNLKLSKVNMLSKVKEEDLLQLIGSIPE
jgi:hypothetical protein